MPTRLYKFTKAEFALRALEHRRLKISTIDDLNDPFDLYAVDTTDRGVEVFLEAHIQEFRAKHGLLCFCRNWDNLLPGATTGMATPAFALVSTSRTTVHTIWKFITSRMSSRFRVSAKSTSASSNGYCGRSMKAGVTNRNRVCSLVLMHLRMRTGGAISI